MRHEVGVTLFGHPVGTLWWSGGRLAFGYAQAWLDDAGAVALSQSLPLRPEPFDDIECRPFFAGLLPEGPLRRLVARQFQVSSQNDFALLRAIGGECAGAVALGPPAAAAGAPQGAGRDTPGIEWLEEAQVSAVLDELPRRPLLAGRGGMRLSLAGAQDKLPVVFDGRRIGLPRGGQPSTHILKPPIASVPDSVVNEAFCLALAQAAGLPAAGAQRFHAGGREVLLVERYDRRMAGGDMPLRLHQEDFCQALGVVPEAKYQNEGGPDLKACFDLLRRVTRPSAPNVLRLLDAAVFNALTGNHDAHAKNFSLLYPGGEGDRLPLLAPLYDLLCTAVYENLTPKMAMKLGGRYKFSEVQARHWEAFAQSAGLSPAQTRRRILRMARQLPEVANRLQSQPHFDGQPIVARIVALVAQRSALTVRRLTPPPPPSRTQTAPAPRAAG